MIRKNGIPVESRWGKGQKMICIFAKTPKNG
jgi:hypothetical protein